VFGLFLDVLDSRRDGRVGACFGNFHDTGGDRVQIDVSARASSDSSSSIATLLKRSSKHAPRGSGQKLVAWQGRTWKPELPDL